MNKTFDQWLDEVKGRAEKYDSVHESDMPVWDVIESDIQYVPLARTDIETLVAMVEYMKNGLCEPWPDCKGCIMSDDYCWRAKFFEKLEGMVK